MYSPKRKIPWVALRKESVDRNIKQFAFDSETGVALRKESVDRNTHPVTIPVRVIVALRKESVDRNLFYGSDLTYSDGRSPQGERG